MRISSLAFTWGTGELVGHYTQVRRSAVQAPEVLLAVSRVREEAFVLTLKICPGIKDHESKSYEFKICGVESVKYTCFPAL